MIGKEAPPAINIILIFYKAKSLSIFTFLTYDNINLLNDSEQSSVYQHLRKLVLHRLSGRNKSLRLLIL